METVFPAVSILSQWAVSIPIEEANLAVILTSLTPAICSEHMQSPDSLASGFKVNK